MLSAKEIFEHLQFNLDKLNLKYKLDNNHPFEFTPTNNESSILEKFLNKIHTNDAMYLRTIPVTSLEQAYSELLLAGYKEREHSDKRRDKNKDYKYRDRCSREDDQDRTNKRNCEDSGRNDNYRHVSSRNRQQPPEPMEVNNTQSVQDFRSTASETSIFQ
ncbi:unnamed protein product [Hermetia illucens]|uniref:Uncharacterized protein n=1 Tax=Hermetia illucens TaxID=343691 RepID=A0A7R8YTR9_HERIL|nr:unnamed protein product [Hermetia illucens]